MIDGNTIPILYPEEQQKLNDYLELALIPWVVETVEGGEYLKSSFFGV